jgi:hypothetical protein
MGIMDKANDLSRTINEKTKTVSSLANLKRKTLYEYERIDEILHEIGKLYYRDYEANVNLILAHCDDIDDRERRIKAMKTEFYNIRGYKLCAKCQAQVGMKMQYCGNCGAVVPDPSDNYGFDEEVPDEG